MDWFLGLPLSNFHGTFGWNWRRYGGYDQRHPIDLKWSRPNKLDVIQLTECSLKTKMIKQWVIYLDFLCISAEVVWVFAFQIGDDCINLTFELVEELFSFSLQWFCLIFVRQKNAYNCLKIIIFESKFQSWNYTNLFGEFIELCAQIGFEFAEFGLCFVHQFLIAFNTDQIQERVMELVKCGISHIPCIFPGISSCCCCCCCCIASNTTNGNLNFDLSKISQLA